MEKVQRKLIREARRRHKKIYPCGTKRNIKECFTLQNDKVLFWYNTKDSNTHLLIDKVLE